MKSWPTLVPLRHARFYAPKEEVFVTCCQLACKEGVFAARTIIPFSQHLRRWNWQRVGASPKIIWRERSTPVCCPNYKTNTKGAFFWENPKTDLWSQIIRILHYQKNGRSEKGSWQRNVLVLLVEKKKQTDPHDEDKKKKQHELGMNIRNVFISVWNTNVSPIEYTP